MLLLGELKSHLKKKLASLQILYENYINMDP